MEYVVLIVSSIDDIMLRITKEEKLCEGCGSCLKACPHMPSTDGFMQCKHCAPESAKCALACPRMALRETGRGILGVDSKLCNGCGKCARACSCIEIKGNVAAKCDLCSESSFELKCVAACASGALKAEREYAELKEAERLLGWYVQSVSFAKVLREGEGFEICEKGGERCYRIAGFPELSAQEAWLISEVVGEFHDAQNRKKDCSSAIAVLEEYCSRNAIMLDSEQKEYMRSVLEELIFGYGPLSRLLHNDRLEEIAIIGLGSSKPVYVYDAAFGWLRTNLYYTSEKCVRNLVNKMARKLGRRLTMQTPKMNAVLEDGTRLCAVAEPVALSGPSVTLRKFRSRRFTPLDLISGGTASAEAIAFLWAAMQSECSIVVCGNTGCGKTTTLNALFSFVPWHERIVVTEETPEIDLPHSHVVKMGVVDNLGIGMNSLIMDTLRMRPDRVVVGEMRNSSEVQAFMDTLLAGQGKGSYATFHAQSAEEALMRLSNLGVVEMDIPAIDLLVVQRRWGKVNMRNASCSEIRRITEISEVCRGRNGKAGLRALYSFNHARDRLEKAECSAKLEPKMMRTFGLSREELASEIARRAHSLKDASRRETSRDDFFRMVNTGVV